MFLCFVVVVVCFFSFLLLLLFVLFFGVCVCVCVCVCVTDRPNCAKFPSLKCAHISLWLNPTGHSKFHNTSNHPPPATDSSRTACTLLYPPVQAPPYSLPHFFLSRTEKPPVTGVRYNSLL